jgi:hydroxymethylglutaryl-CoA lyase
MTNSFHIIECPRDALQGLGHFVPTEKKAEYLNLLLKVGFHTLDFGSFVSPKAVPQMADTAQVLDLLELNAKTKLLAIVANMRGVETACLYPQIDYLGFPLSVSETFQQRNTNSDIAQGLELVKLALNKCDHYDKQLVVYLSMAFGNPYQEAYSTKKVLDLAHKLELLGCQIVSLADTVGMASTSDISILGVEMIRHFPQLEIGMHLHTRPDEALEKIKAVWNTGIKRIDTALGGLGGCPFASDDLVGNMPTESLLAWDKKNSLGINTSALQKASHFLQTEIIGSQHA